MGSFGVWNGLIPFMLFLVGKDDPACKQPSGTDEVRKARLHCTRNAYNSKRKNNLIFFNGRRILIDFFPKKANRWPAGE